MKLLDLYCGGGGCSKGYADVGFEITGVDIAPQRNYPYHFIQSDAIEYLLMHFHEFDAVHASPPCQHHSESTKIWKPNGRTYPELVIPTRDALIKCGLPYVIENVPGAPLNNPITLCGVMFSRPFYRHRLFETSFSVTQPAHGPHLAPQVKMGRVARPGEYIQTVGHFSGVQQAREALEIPWMSRDELAQAIPPCYTRYVGRRLMDVLTEKG